MPTGQNHGSFNQFPEKLISALPAGGPLAKRTIGKVDELWFGGGRVDRNREQGQLARVFRHELLRQTGAAELHCLGVNVGN